MLNTVVEEQTPTLAMPKSLSVTFNTLSDSIRSVTTKTGKIQDSRIITHNPIKLISFVHFVSFLTFFHFPGELILIRFLSWTRGLRQSLMWEGGWSSYLREERGGSPWILLEVSSWWFDFLAAIIVQLYYTIPRVMLNYLKALVLLCKRIVKVCYTASL